MANHSEWCEGEGPARPNIRRRNFLSFPSNVIARGRLAHITHSTYEASSMAARMDAASLIATLSSLLKRLQIVQTSLAEGDPDVGPEVQQLELEKLEGALLSCDGSMSYLL
jgi:hypothetical protein